MKNSELLDTWELATTDRDEFLTMLENLSKATKLLELQTHAFSMYTLRTFSKNDVGGYLQGNGLSIQKDYLIDDRGKNGTSEFEGEWIQFGSARFPDWETVVSYLLAAVLAVPITYVLVKYFAFGGAKKNVK